MEENRGLGNHHTQPEPPTCQSCQQHTLEKTATLILSGKKTGFPHGEE